jgi:hypothetical protein
MKIKIEELQNDNFCFFSSNIGSGAGFWAGKSMPFIKSSYDVEIDIDSKFEEGISAFISSNSNNAIMLDGDYLVLNGTIDSIDEDRMVFLRMSLDCLFMIEGGNYKFKVGDWITFKTKISKVKIWPIGY